MKSYKPEELFNEDGSIKEEIKNICPPLEKTMGLNKNANGGLLIKELKLPENLMDYELPIKRGQTQNEDMRSLGSYIRDVMNLNKDNYTLDNLKVQDKWILNKCNNLIKSTIKHMDKYEFNVVGTEVYNFVLVGYYFAYTPA